ncbi:hypothetical protein BDA99DRAFT_542906 [Phascolomyces articulosus]|uniref:F-box domain-containing protein n=1 Tax=Phascolomyces articulosus TaxID=60185 RepID=A0AAD5JYX7_9FUNG|nr:hypothetical protein BDA99DRAFT_542906 [Phascolomyces articulosus]
MTSTTIIPTSNHCSLHSSVDFISALPFDLVPLILKNFSSVELLNLFSVSKIWKERLLSCYESYLSIVIFRWELNTNILKELNTVADKVVHLGLTFIASEGLYTRALQLLESGIFVNLKHLEITDCNLSKNTTILPALYAVSNTLKELKLSTRSSGVSLQRVVSVCQGLERLWWSSATDTQTGIMNYNAIKNFYNKNTNLTHLIVSAPSVYMSFIRQLTDLCPNVRHLCIGTFSSQDALHSIKQSYGSQLEYLSLNPESCSVSTWFELGVKTKTTATRVDHHCAGHSSDGLLQGLRHLDSYKHNELALVSLIEEHNSTIEELKIRGRKQSYFPVNVVEHQLINNIFQKCSKPFLNLHTLWISQYSHYPHMIPMLMSHVSVTLQELSFSTCNLQDPSIFQSIKKLTGLKRLSFCYKVQVDHSDLLGLIQHFAITNKKNVNNNKNNNNINASSSFITRERQNQQIQSIRISGEEMSLDDIILRELVKIETLQELGIYCTEEIADENMDEICELLRQCGACLQILELSSRIQLNNKALRQLSHLPSLEILTVWSEQQKITTRKVLLDFLDQVYT